MTLVKLDSGDYINTDFVRRLYKYDDDDWKCEVGETNWDMVSLTDRNRIVEAMNPQKTSREILVKEMLLKAQAIADLSTILNYTDGGIDVAKALLGISDDLSMVANA